MQNLTGLSEIARHYDGVLFDIFGVIHDGETCFQGALTALQGLQKAGIAYGFLSNMPLRAARVGRSLQRRGVPEALLAPAVTSGEAVFQALRAGGFGRRYCFVGPESTREIIPPGYQETPVETADFVLVSGIGDDDTPDDHTDLLTTAHARALPMLCANPDLRVSRGARVVACAGLLADAYARMGGDTRWMGKPHGQVFSMAREMLGGRLLMVGDSLRTDIAGARAAGLDTLYIRGGIDEGTGEERFAQYATMPDYALPRLCWQG